MRFLSRNKIYDRLAPSKDSSKIYVICEGAKTEVKYFSYFDKFSSNLQIITVPPENNQTSPDKLMALCERKFFTENSQLSITDRDEIWFVIDTDQWNVGNKIAKLKEYCCTKQEQSYRVFMVQSNRSFEVWHYYHHYATAPNEEELVNFGSFKEYLHEKIAGGFNPNTMPILIFEAIENAKSNFSCDENDQPILHASEVFRLGERIVELIGPDLKLAKKQAKISGD